MDIRKLLSFFRPLQPPSHATWRTLGSAGHGSLSWAEWYFAGVSQPIYVFIVMHFLYRVCLWWRALWMISRLDLQLRGAHSDEAGGLMFLGYSLPPCRLPAFALAAGLAGGLANLVLATGVSVLNFKYVIIAMSLLITGLFAGPLVFFNPQLRRAKFRASLSHDRTLLEQLRQFEQKWIGQSRDTNLLEVPDFSAVIDLSSTVDTVHEMSRFPIRGHALVELIVATLLPFLPVLALQIPIKIFWRCSRNFCRRFRLDAMFRDLRLCWLSPRSLPGHPVPHGSELDFDYGARVGR